jgi:hypothetical protein
VESAESSLDATREALDRVAARVLARRRWEVSGRFGLRSVPGGISTPAPSTTLGSLNRRAVYNQRHTRARRRYCPLT